MRVIILGTSGAGKSTFAKHLAEARGCPYVDLDDLHWEPGWIEAPDEVMIERLQAAIAAPAWVVAGNYAHLRDIHWPRATHLVWLDYSRPLVMRRVFVRTLRRWLRRETCCNGNRESLRMSFLSKDSILLWAWTSYHRRKTEFDGYFQTPPYPQLEMLRVKTPREAEGLLSELSGANPATRQAG
ncbi:MAG: adenylate kinaselike kinase [Cyanobacteria bacterium RYN_339]|nr:adenylate kinaselike kinase [Cyanobacteria bacterium RYN_339]